MISFEAIGTHWAIDILEPINLELRRELKAAIQQRIETYDKVYSRFREDSLVTLMAHTPGSYELPSDSQALFRLYRQLYELSNGAVTPLIGQMMSDAGYDAEYSFVQRPLISAPDWDEVMSYHDNQLTMNGAALLDFGAAGKGQLVDLVAEIITRAGISDFIVDAGGDMLIHSSEPIEIGLENPHNTEQALGVIALQRGALCGSASNRRRWGSYHHIMDPRTRSSVEGIDAIWVNAGTTLLADGLTTALYFVPAEQLARHFDFSYAILKNHHELEASPTFPARFFR